MPKSHLIIRSHYTVFVHTGHVEWWITFVCINQQIPRVMSWLAHLFHHSYVHMSLITHTSLHCTGHRSSHFRFLVDLKLWQIGQYRDKLNFLLTVHHSISVWWLIVHHSISVWWLTVHHSTSVWWLTVHHSISVWWLTCIIAHQYGDWLCIIVHQYGDWPCIIAHQYGGWPCIIVHQYGDWPCIIAHQYGEWPCIMVLYISMVTDRASWYCTSVWWLTVHHSTSVWWLTVHHSISVWWNQRDALFIQFIKNEGPLHVSSVTCSSSGGYAKTTLGILHACYVSWLHQGCSVPRWLHYTEMVTRLLAGRPGFRGPIRGQARADFLFTAATPALELIMKLPLSGI
jgi:hypothetical protein